MSAVVIDANLAVALAIALPYSERAVTLMADWARERVCVYAPLLWEYEVVSALRKAVALGLLPVDEAPYTLERLWALGVQPVPPGPDLHRQALAWAERLGQTVAYDAQYLALAEGLGAVLWTADRRLSRRAADLGISWVRYIEDAEG